MHTHQVSSAEATGSNILNCRKGQVYYQELRGKMITMLGQWLNKGKPRKQISQHQ